MEYQTAPVSLEGYDEPLNNASPPTLASAINTSEQPQIVPLKPKKSLQSRLTLPALIIAIFALPAAAIFAVSQRVQPMTQAQRNAFASQRLDLNSLNLAVSPNKELASTLAINGQLQVAQSVQVSPNTKPLNPQAGQIYYDKTTNQLGYYNGTGFVYLQGGGSNTIVNNTTTNTTVVNNYSSSAPEAPPAVLLQGSTPGVPQSGNFTIGGTGTMNIGNINTGNIDTATINSATVSDATITTGTIDTATITTGNIDTANIATGNIELVNTTEIESGGNAFAINQYEPIPGGQDVTAGYTNIGSSTTRPYGMFGTKVTTGSSGGPMNSVSVYLGDACQNNTILGCSGPATNASFEIGIYSDDGDLVSNKPQTLLTQAGPFYANDGDFTLNSWNTLDVPSLPLQPFTGYWIVFKVLGTWSGYDGIEFKYKTNSNDGNSFTFTDQSWCSWAAWGMPASGPLATCFGGTGPYYAKNDLSAYLNYTTDPSTGGAGAMFSLSPTGQASFRATEDSLNAFKIQNAASATTIFNVDTYNMRVAIGKPTADYLLDVGNGDVNMVSGRSLRFGGVKVLTASTTATSLAGGTITLQGAATLSSTAAIQGAATFASTVSVTGATTLNGAATLNNTVTNKVGSTTAFRIQNASSIDLFVADTTNRVITVKGVDTAFASLTLTDAHFKSTQTNVPTISTPTNCGTTPTATVTAGSTDSAGSLTITTGTGGTSSTCDTTITFRRAYGAAPKSIIVVGKGTVASAQRQIYVTSSTATTFTISFANSAAGADSTAYGFNYWVIE